MPLFTVCVWARGAQGDHVQDMSLPLPIHYVWLSEFSLLKINEKFNVDNYVILNGGSHIESDFRRVL